MVDLNFTNEIAKIASTDLFKRDGEGGELPLRRLGAPRQVSQHRVADLARSRDAAQVRG
jgi:hypothetical protein